MIEKIILKNYRNLNLEEGLTFDPLTIFVGPNGSGKTNVIRVLRFLQDAWISAEAERRGVSRFENAIERLGSARILDKRQGVPAVVSVDTHFRLQHGYHQGYELDLDVRNQNGVSVRREIMQRWPENSYPMAGSHYFEADLAAKKVVVTRIHEGETTPPQNLPELKLMNELPANELTVHSLPNWLEAHSDTPLKDIPFFEGKRLLEDFIREWTFYEASQWNIDAIRQLSPEIGVGDRTLMPSGRNLALVLFNLSQHSIDFAEKIVDLMRELFPETRALRTSVIGRTAVTVEWYLKGIDSPFYLDEMSEGTVRMLCWAAILFSPKMPRLLVIDEPETSLHPAWLRVLAGWIRDAARRTQIIVSTHSPDLLDYFTAEMASVRIFDKDPDNPLYTRIQKVKEEAIADKVAEGWQLGDLYRVGDPQLGGWPW